MKRTRLFCRARAGRGWLLAALLLLLLAAPAGAGDQPWYRDLSGEWGGHLRLQGFVSEVPEDSYFQPVGTGAYYDGRTDLRLKGKLFMGQSAYLQAHYQLILKGGDTRRRARALAAAGLVPVGGLPGSAISDRRRLLDLTSVISREDGYVLYHRLDRLNLSFTPSWGGLRIGRQALTWGNGFLFNPMDLFNPFSPTNFLRDYKLGDDMVTLQVNLPAGAGFQALVVPRRDPLSGEVESDQSSAAAKLHLVRGMTEFDLMAAQHYGDQVLGAGAVGYLGNVAWRANATWTFTDGAESGYLSLVANLDYSWTWWGKNFYGWIEFYFNGLGRDDYTGALQDQALMERWARGEMFTLGRAYLDAQLKIELHPLLSLYCNLINNLHDPSGILQPRAVWDLSQNSQITLGANIYYGGPGSEYGGFTPTGWSRRYVSPSSAYAWFTYFF